MLTRRRLGSPPGQPEPELNLSSSCLCQGVLHSTQSRPAQSLGILSAGVQLPSGSCGCQVASPADRTATLREAHPQEFAWGGPMKSRSGRFRVRPRKLSTRSASGPPPVTNVRFFSSPTGSCRESAFGGHGPSSTSHARAVPIASPSFDVGTCLQWR